MRLLASALFLLSYQATAGVILADWQCLSAPAFPVEVTIDQRGVRLDPNIFDSQRRYEASEGLSNCIENFRQRVSQSVATFKQSNCANAAADPLCQSNLDAVNGRVTEHIGRGELSRRNRITLGPLVAATPDVVPTRPDQGGQVPTPGGEAVTPARPDQGGQVPTPGGEAVIPARPDQGGQVPTPGGEAVTPARPGQGGQVPTPGGEAVTPARPDTGSEMVQTPAGPQSPARTEVNRFLRSEIAAGRINPSNPSGTFVHNGRTLRVGDYENAIGDGMSDLFNRVDRNQASQTLQNYMVARASLLQGNSLLRTDIMSNLQRLFNQLHGSRGPDEMARAMEECLQPPAGQASGGLFNWLSSLSSGQRCTELRPGENRLITSTADATEYLLTRRPDGNYQAAITINFRQGPGANVSNQAMMNKARSCLAQTNGSMRGPDGQMLEIAILTPEERGQLPSSSRPRIRDVEVAAPGWRATSSSFNSDIDCAALTHEMLHQLGLCDEYDDRVPFVPGPASPTPPAGATAAPVYACRPIPTRATIMNYHYAVYPQAVPTSVSCSCTSALCRAASRGDERLRQAYFGAKLNDIAGIDLSNACVPQEASPRPIPGGASLSVIPQGTSGAIVDEAEVSLVGSRAQIRTRRTICNCNPNDNRCMVQLELLQRAARNPGYTSQCPPGEQPLSGGTGTVSGAVARPSISAQGGQVTIQNPPRIPSMLEPNHFYKILEGTCSGGRSATYQRCAEFSTRSHRCEERPRECESAEHFLGSRQ